MTRHARSSSTTKTVDPRTSSGVGAIGLGGVNGMARKSPAVYRWQMASSASATTRRHASNGAVPGREVTAKPRRTPSTIVPAATPAKLVQELASCLTEADILQVLYRNLQPRFGYDVILLTVLEKDGWQRVLPIDSGVLQDSRRLPLSGSAFARQYANPKLTVLPAGTKTQTRGRGPGSGQRIKFVIWAPVEHQRQLIGAVVYQSHRSRRVPSAEIAFLD